MGDCAEQVVVLGRQSALEQRQEERERVAGHHVRVAGVRVAEVADVVQTIVDVAGPRQCRRHWTLRRR